MTMTTTTTTKKRYRVRLGGFNFATFTDAPVSRPEDLQPRWRERSVYQDTYGRVHVKPRSLEGRTHRGEVLEVEADSPGGAEHEFRRLCGIRQTNPDGKGNAEFHVEEVVEGDVFVPEPTLSEPRTESGAVAAAIKDLDALPGDLSADDISEALAGRRPKAKK